MDESFFFSSLFQNAEKTFPVLTACDRLYYCVESEDISILATIFAVLFPRYTVWFSSGA